MYNQYLEIVDGHGISAASEGEGREGNLYLVPGTTRCYRFPFLPVQEDVGSTLEVQAQASYLRQIWGWNSETFPLLKKYVLFPFHIEKFKTLSFKKSWW